MADQLVTLWRYRDLPEALVAAAKLDSQEIPCTLADDNIVRLDWFWSNAVGGIRLQVADDQAQLALELLQEEIPESFTAEEIGEEYQQPRCPNCRSRDVSYRASYRKLGVVVLGMMALDRPLFVVPALLGFISWPRWNCEDCGHAWRAPYD